ncbi:MAG TPA: hypothetical protein VFD58_22900 [Blastocatellia bacterium]|nr:hypothetical protein [Blastocatellia bacterium]
MRSALARLSVCFAGGCVGGLLNSLAMWGAGEAHVTARLGVKLAPAFSWEWLLPRVLWGGLWGLLFLLPIMRRHSVLLRGLVVSLAPTLAQLFYFFPQSQRGVLGLSLGQLTPLFVLLFNAVWGVTAAWWVRSSGIN